MPGKYRYVVKKLSVVQVEGGGKTGGGFREKPGIEI
jgi:hypothetical protein